MSNRRTSGIWKRRGDRKITVPIFGTAGGRWRRPSGYLTFPSTSSRIPMGALPENRYFNAVPHQTILYYIYINRTVSREQSTPKEEEMRKIMARKPYRMGMLFVVVVAAVLALVAGGALAAGARRHQHGGSENPRVASRRRPGDGDGDRQGTAVQERGRSCQRKGDRQVEAGEDQAAGDRRRSAGRPAHRPPREAAAGAAAPAATPKATTAPPPTQKAPRRRSRLPRPRYPRAPSTSTPPLRSNWWHCRRSARKSASHHRRAAIPEDRGHHEGEGNQAEDIRQDQGHDYRQVT